MSSFSLINHEFSSYCKSQTDTTDVKKLQTDAARLLGRRSSHRSYTRTRGPISHIQTGAARFLDRRRTQKRANHAWCGRYRPTAWAPLVKSLRKAVLKLSFVIPDILGGEHMAARVIVVKITSRFCSCCVGIMAWNKKWDQPGQALGGIMV
jgi:hypothetical protein